MYIYRYNYIHYIWTLSHISYHRTFFSPSSHDPKWGTISWGQVAIQAFAMALAAGMTCTKWATYPLGIKYGNGQSPIYDDFPIIMKPPFIDIGDFPSAMFDYPGLSVRCRHSWSVFILDRPTDKLVTNNWDSEDSSTGELPKEALLEMHAMHAVLNLSTILCLQHCPPVLESGIHLAAI